ncbi:MAG: class I tRNA ligase family protein, partial [Alicyclobacillus sp.]|nr:class I tRNA ligase family protein [Alicyclobacillus sp.]
ICEAIDQTRGWFYSLLAISTLMTGRAPYKNVLVLGHVVDESGKKMSKSKGNVIDPFEAFDLHGADALRFYFLSNTQPWNSQRFFHRAVAESKAKFVDLLQNVHAFYALYASIDGFDPAAYDVPIADRPLMDRWMLARLHDTIQKMDTWMDVYDATSAARALQRLVDDLSTWYVRRNRERFWAGGMEADKAAAFCTLYEVLVAVAKLAAPMTPFIAEQIYQNVARSADPNQPLSVHLCDYPKADPAYIDQTLLAEMDEVLAVVEAGRHLRNETKMKTRQPLSKLYLPADQAGVLRKFADVLCDELNVKELVFTELVEVAKPELFLNLKAVGQDYGRLVPVLNQAAKNATPAQIGEFQQQGEVYLEGQRIGSEHAELRYHPNFTGMLVVTPRGFVGLDTALTPELIEEGFVRELISKMQMMRKEVNYNVTDKVTFAAAGDEEVLRVLRDNQAEIAATVLVKSFVFGETGSGDLTKDWDINGKSLTLTVRR